MVPFFRTKGLFDEFKSFRQNGNTSIFFEIAEHGITKIIAIYLALDVKPDVKREDRARCKFADSR